MKAAEHPLPKRVLIDANFLVALISSTTNKDERLKLNYFVRRLEEQKCQMVVPMPALAEYLVGADIGGVEALNLLEKKTYVLAASFDRAAAYECSLLDRAAIQGGTGDKRDGVDAPWQKVKFDRQIVAIGKAHNVQLVITGDKGVKAAALRCGMSAMTVAELPLAPEDAQQTLNLQQPKAKPKAKP